VRYSIKISADFDDDTQILLCEMVFNVGGLVEVIQHVPDAALVKNIMQQAVSAAKYTAQQEQPKRKGH
jgi:hypothetical protein